MQWGWAPEGVDGELPVGATKLGGEPDLPEGTSWPTGDDDRPLAFVAQIAVGDLAAAGVVGLPAGLLSFFFAFDETMSGGCVLHSGDGEAQDDPRTVGDVLLLQVDLGDDALTEFGEGRMYWFINADDLGRGRFDRARGQFQQT